MLTLTACASSAPTRPAAWGAPEALVAPSSFTGVHGLAVDGKGRLLAGSAVGYSMWEVDRQSGVARVLIAAPEGQADDIAVGPKGELAWTNYLMGMVRYRESDTAPIKVLARDLPGLNSLDFDRKNGKLYASQVFLGDALWELDVAGVKAPRLIAKDIGGFNGFEVGPDGMLYGPLWFKGQVVKIDPAVGAITVINSEFKVPAAANLDGKGNLWVIDTRTGELCRVDLASGRKTVVKQLKTALDNLAIAPDGTVYVSNMADNSIEAFNPATGALRTLTAGKLAVPAGLKLDGDSLWVADVFGFRQVNVKTGDVKDIFRMQASDMEYPFAVGVSTKLFALTSWFTGTVQLVDRATLKTVHTIHALKAPFNALPMEDGSVLYAEIATGKLTRIDLASGAKTEVASGLALPEGVAQTPWGTFIVAEAAAGKLTEIDPASGTRRSVAQNLPIGLAAGPGMPPPYVVTGVAVGADGTVYFSADKNNAVYRIKPQR